MSIKTKTPVARVKGRKQSRTRKVTSKRTSKTVDVIATAFIIQALNNHRCASFDLKTQRAVDVVKQILPGFNGTLKDSQDKWLTIPSGYGSHAIAFKNELKARGLNVDCRIAP